LRGKVARSWFRQSFDRSIEEFRERYRDFFEDLDTGLPLLEARHLVAMSEYGILSEPSLDEELGKRYEEEMLREVEELGIEAVARYIPYHLARNWGIYIFLEKLNGLASLVSRILSIPFDDAFRSCEKGVIEHECFHFHTEYSATIMETVIVRPRYISYFQASRPYDVDEEAIANAWMLTSRSPVIARIMPELRRICDVSPWGYRDYGKYVAGNRVDYGRVREFWASRFLGSAEPVFLPVRLEMPSSYTLTPIYYVQTLKAPELADALHLISNNWRILDVVKKLKEVLQDEILEASATEILLKTGQVIPLHYHPKEGGTKLVRLVNEVADKLGVERKWLREYVFRRRGGARSMEVYFEELRKVS
jgi:hypothetical protein